MTDALTDPRRIDTRDDFAAGLSAIRRRADLSIRELSRLTGVPAATLGGYFSGRNLPQPGQVARLRLALEACGVAPGDVEAWVEAAGRARTQPAQDRPRSAPPYPGLTSFDVDDAAVFFGRAAETAQILERLAQLRDGTRPGGMLAVIGPSGSGKTSLLRAGVAAALYADPSWSCLVRTPGAEPLATLAAARQTFGTGTPVLVVDQFEELFTSVDDVTRAAFVDELVALAPDVLVVIGMRADFYAAAAREPLLLPVLQHEQFLLGPLAPAQLREAIERPAAVAGMSVESGLVDVVLAALAPRDASGAPHDAGALPMLSHALRAAWQRGKSSTLLTLADYHDAGGLDGAIARTAEEVFDRLDEHERDSARALLLRLVNIDDVAVTRRRVSGAELEALRRPPNAGIIDSFVRRRLFTADRDSLQISHEALLVAWPRLRSWVDEDRLGLKLHRQVTEAATTWDQGGRDDSGVLRGSRLDAAVELSTRPTLRTHLVPLERDYLAASLAARDAAQDRARRGTRRLRRLLAAVAVLFVVAAGLATFAFKARSTADAAQREAAAARDNALSRQVALQARQMLPTDPALSQQLAIASFRIARTSEARAAVIEATARPVVTRFLGPAGRTPAALSTDGSLAAVGQADGTVRLLRPSGDRPRQLGTLRAPGARHAVTAVALTPDARTLFAADDAARLTIWDVTRPSAAVRLSATALAPGSVVAALSVDRTGTDLLAAGAGPVPLQRWRVTDPRRPVRVAAPAGLARGIQLYSLARSDDGRYLAAGGDAEVAYVWDRGAAAPRRVPTGAHRQLALRFSGARLFVGDSAGVVTAVDPASGRRLAATTVADAGWAQTLTLSPDGRTIGVGYDDSTFRRFDATTLALIGRQRTPREIVTAAYLPDGTGVVLTCTDGATYVVPVAGRSVPSPATTFNLSVDSAGSRLVAATSGGGGGLRVWDTRGQRPVPVTPFIRMTDTDESATGGGTISPDGSLVAMNNFVGDVQLFDIRDPARPRAWAPPFRAATELVESLSVSPDGATLALASDDRTMSLWDVRRPARPVLLSRSRAGESLYDIAWSPDGRSVAAAGAGSKAYLWTVTDLRRPTLRATLPNGSPQGGGTTFSHSGRLLATTGSSGRTRLWDVSGTGAPRPLGGPLTGPTDYANGADFSPDDSRLAVTSTDATVRLYDVTAAARTPQVTLDAGAPVFSARFSPDGRRLIAAGRSDAAPVFTVDPAAAARNLCARSGDGITRAEWSQYVPDADYQPPCR